MAWSWPNDNWILIGFERWDYFRKYPHTRQMEGMYQDPNFLTPVGHWHVTYHGNGQQRSCTWLPNALEEPQHLYLKGMGKGQEDEGQEGEGKGQGNGKGKNGKGKGGKGKGGKGKA